MFQTADRKPASNAHGRVVTGRRPVYDEAGECIGSVNGAGGVYDTDGGRSVAARVLIDENGAPRDFWTDDRYADLPGGLVRSRWRTPVEGWTVVAGRPVPVGAKAVWQLTSGPFTYAELEFDEVVHDPAALPR